MKTPYISPLLFLLNIVLFLFIAARPGVQQTFEKITVKEFELVGDDGNRRANIKVESDGVVVFRMMDKSGTIRVKLAADENGSGLVLLNESTEPGFHATAKKEASTVTVLDSNGKKRKL